MTRFTRMLLPALPWVLLLLIAGCATKGEPGNSRSNNNAAYAITCIGVPPTGTVIDYDGELSFAQAKALKQGARVMDELLQRELGPAKKARFVLNEQLLEVSEFLPKDPLARARFVGKFLSCNTVLETTMRRYEERIGGQYTASSPASVSFKYRLIELERGSVLCKGEFDETQRSVTENLLEFHKAKNRGFTWIDAEELMSEGLAELFDRCVYLDSDQNQ